MKEFILHFKIWTNPGLFLFIFVLFKLKYKFKLKKQSVDVVDGIRTRSCRIVGAEGSTELWLPPYN